MRLKSELWVKAYIRRLSGEGIFAVVVQKGAAEAGAIYVKQARLDGTAMAFAPAPLGFGVDVSDRQWISFFGDEPVEETKVDDYLRQQAEFDSDIWVIEVEDRAGRHFMDDWLRAT